MASRYSYDVRLSPAIEHRFSRLTKLIEKVAEYEHTPSWLKLYQEVALMKISDTRVFGYEEFKNQVSFTIRVIQHQCLTKLDSNFNEILNVQISGSHFRVWVFILLRSTLLIEVIEAHFFHFIL